MTPTDEAELLRLLPYLREVVQEQGQVGAPKLLRRLFVLEAEGTVDVASGDQALIALSSVDISAGLPNGQPHRFWLYSVVYEHVSIFSYQTVGHVAGVGDTEINAGLQCWIQTRRTTSTPKAIAADLVISYHGAGTASGVAYKAYRIAGLT